MSTLTTTTTVRGVSTIVAHSKFSRGEVETRTETSITTTRGQCCHEGLEGRLNSSTKACARDLPGTENFRTCGDGENSESSGHSQGCSGDSHDECQHHDNAPCDCCRHGHSLTSFIRNPDDCRTCLRHMGGTFVSPKYTQAKQRLLKTLNQRRDHSEENPDTSSNNRVEAPNASAKSVPCGKKERLIILNPENQSDNVDDLVRMIEGTKITNDPKKAAKKARQKERKEQTKIEEDRQKEEEERKLREREEQLVREQQEREEEEKRKAEEQKRQARRQKKKNRKKRDADKSAGDEDPPTVPNNVKDDPIALAVNNVNSTSPSEAVRKVLETVKPIPDATAGDKPRMVTIRRHPATQDNQNVVTITMSDDKEGKSPVYMLVNGQLVSGDNLVNNQPSVTDIDEHEQNGSSDKKKKKKKKRVSCDESTNDVLQSGYQPGASIMSSNEITVRPSIVMDNQSHLDLEHLNLPPGITITKVPSINKEPIKEIRTNVEKVHSFASNVDQHSYYMDDDDDFFGRKENEEFEEVVSSKNRRKRNKAAKTKDRDGSEETDTRESPSSIKHMTRRPLLGDSKSVDKAGDSQISKWNGNTKGAKVGLKKVVPTPGVKTVDHHNPQKIRRDYTTRYTDVGAQGYSPTSHSSVPVMPRLCRTMIRNGDCLENAMYESLEGRPNADHNKAAAKLLSYEQPKLTPVINESRHAETNNVSHHQQQQHSFVNNSSQLFSAAQGASKHFNQNYNQSSWLQSNAASNVQKVIQRPCSIQSESNVESWSPWKNWSEHSTPEHPTSRFGFEQSYGKDAPSNNMFAFQDQINRTNPSRKSPIQRPVHGQAETPSSMNVYDGYNQFAARETNVPGSQSHFFQEDNLYRLLQPVPPPRVEQPISNFSNPKSDAPVNRRVEDNMSWNSFAGVQPSYLQRRPSDKADLVLTQTNASPSVPDQPLWEPFQRKSSPYSDPSPPLDHIMAQQLRSLRMSGIAESIPAGISVHPSYDSYQMKRLETELQQQHQQQLPVPHQTTFPSNPNWQNSPAHNLSNTNNFAELVELPAPGTAVWGMNNSYSTYNGGLP